MFALLLTALVAQASPMTSTTPSPTPSVAPSSTPSVAPTASAAPFVFVPPADWTSMGMQGSVGTGDTQTTMVGMWGPSPRDGSSINVAVASSGGLSEDAFIAKTETLLKSLNGYTLISTTPITLCNGVQAKLLRSTWVVLQHRVTVSQLFAINDGHAYIGTYTRATMIDSQPALNALAGLCPSGLPQSTPAKAEALAPIVGPAGWAPSSLGNTSASTGARMPSIWLWTNPATAPGSEVVEAVTVQVPAVVVPPASAAVNDYYVQSFANGMKMWASNLTIIDQKPIQLCSTPGISLRMTATAFTKPVEIDVVLAPGSPTTYAALYLRTKGVAENPDAIKAIDSLCPADHQATSS